MSKQRCIQGVVAIVSVLTIVACSVGAKTKPKSSTSGADASAIPTPVNAVNGLLIAGNCAVPGAGSGKTFYVDPVNGSNNGDGSKAHPWHTLSEVIDAGLISAQQYLIPYDGTTKPLNPNGVIHGGDTILLMSGDHGGVGLMGVFPDFLTIQAAPGQTPIVDTMSIYAGDKVVIRGLKVVGLADSYNPLVNISGSYWGPISNVVFDGNTLLSQDNVSAWSQDDWQNNGRYRGIGVDGGYDANQSNCLSITHNKISNVRYGVSLTGTNILFDSNTIDHYGDDGLDIASNNLVVTHNLITNNLDVGDGNHPDAIQGTLGRVTGAANILINANMIIRQTDPNLAFPNILQGINAFDNDWTNVTITNNIVIANAWNGMGWGSVHGGLIANNTVLNDNSVPNQTTWLAPGGTTHEGSDTNDLIVRNNIATTLIQKDDPGTTFDHNLAQDEFMYPVNDVTTYNYASGTYPGTNLVDNNLSSQLKSFDPVNFKFDVHLLAGNPAATLGSTAQMPTADFSGNARTKASAGAYVP